MDWIIILTILGTAIGLIAGIVQVVQYYQDRMEKKTQLPPSLSKITEKKVFHNLPPRVEFVGRLADKSRLQEALRSRSYLISLEGIGGIGKSTLALEVAHECLDNLTASKPSDSIAKFSGFIWSTAKGRELTLNNLLDIIARTIEQPSIVQQELDDKRSDVCKILQEKPYLLIVDNFETINDPNLRDFLVNLPEPSKALITTREKYLMQSIAISVRELQEFEALELIRKDGQRLGLQDFKDIPDEIFLQLIHATGGAPLAIKWAVGQIKQKGQSLDTVIVSLQSAHGDIFEQIFARSWELLSEDARRALIVLPLFATSTSYAALEKVSEVHHPNLDDALGQLVEMSLVDVIGGLSATERRYGIHPLTRSYAMEKLGSTNQEKKNAIVHLVEYYEDFMKPYRNWTRQKLDFKLLETEIFNLYQAIELCLNNDMYTKAFSFLRSSANFLFRRGYWKDAIELSTLISDTALKHDDKITWAKLQTWPISSILRHRGELDKAMKHINNALSVFDGLDDLGYLASALRHKGRIYQEQGSLEQSEEYLLRANEIFQSLDGDWDLLMVKTNLAELAVQKGELEKAMALCDQARNISSKFYDQEQAANLNIITSQIFLARHDVRQAKSYMQAASTMMQELNRVDGIADTLCGMAKIEIAEKNKKGARSMLNEALGIYSQLGARAKVHEVEKILNSI